MPFAAALSEHPLATHAIGEVVGQVLDVLGDAPDAALLLVTAPFAGAFEDMAAAVRATLRPGALIGSTAAGVWAGERTVVDAPAVALFALRLGPPRRHGPSGLARAVRFGTTREEDGWAVTTDATFDGGRGTLVLLADPQTFPTEAVVDDLSRRARDLTVVGGAGASSAGASGARFVADGLIAHDGAVGLLLPPGLPARAVVSQGCRPVGEPLVVTRATGSMIDEIAGVAALDRLLGQADEATPEDRAAMGRSLHLGIVLDEHRDAFGPGDFAVIPVLGADHERRSVAVGADVAVGSTVQFHVRDARGADEDLRAALADTTGSAGLVFAGVERAREVFDDPHHDATVVGEALDGGAVVGMLCDAEIGPVGGVAGVRRGSATIFALAEPG